MTEQKQARKEGDVLWSHSELGDYDSPVSTSISFLQGAMPFLLDIKTEMSVYQNDATIICGYLNVKKIAELRDALDDWLASQHPR